MLGSAATRGLPLLQDLFAVDTQMGSVISLTAGEQASQARVGMELKHAGHH